MKKEYITHIAKSNYAYAVNENTLHIRIKTIKNTAQSIYLLFGDPFIWDVNAETGKYEWIHSSTESLYLLKEYSTNSFDYWFIEIKSETKRIKYSFVINDQFLFGSRDFLDITVYKDEKYNLFNYFNFPYINAVDLYSPPSWVKDTVWYSIFPDRFNNKDNKKENILPWESVTNYKNNMFFGGNLKGIIDKLDYLQDLGISGLYLTPIFLSPTAHKYDTIDYFEIDPSFGTKEDLHTLIKESHSRGIKVMLDAVFNHCSHLHPFFQDVIKNEENSIYKDCFYINDYPVINFELDENNMPIKAHSYLERPNYETFAFSKGMPKVNTEHPIMREHLLEAGRYWIKEFDIDGWRLDVSNEVSHDFWRAFQKEMRLVKDEIFILGENWDNSMPWLQGDQMDSVMNYEFMYPIWSYFGTNIKTIPYNGEAFVEKITEVITSYPKTVLPNLFNIIDSHDTARIMNICSNNKELVKLVYLFQYSLPGTPSIYYGGEIGMEGDHDPDNRRCMIWDEDRQDKDMFLFLQTLNKLYKKYPEFTSTDIHFRVYNDGLLIYQKDDMIFMINSSSISQGVSIIEQGIYIDVFTNQKRTIKDGLRIKPFGFIVIKKG